MLLKTHDAQHEGKQKNKAMPMGRHDGRLCTETIEALDRDHPGPTSLVIAHMQAVVPDCLAVLQEVCCADGVCCMKRMKVLVVQ